MNKQQSKYFNTASIFDEALVLLLKDKDIEYITIKEICKKAGVNRSTFYLHYESMDNLLNETLEYLIKKLGNHFDETTKEFIDKINDNDKESLILINEKYLKPYLEFVKSNQSVFAASFKNPKVLKSEEQYRDLKKYIINPILDKYNIEEYKRKYIIDFYVYGIMSIIKEWTINGCIEEIDIIIKIIIECVRP